MKRMLGCLIVMAWLEFSLAQPTITNIQALPELFGVDSPRFPLLSPDGSTIFYRQDNTLCFFEIEAETTQCHDYAGTFRNFGRYSMPVWSPDSSRVLFTESFFDAFRESDLWQLEVTTGEYTNLTNDGIDRIRIGNEDPAALIDYFPTFSPTGELYFFRSRPTSGINEVLGPRFSLELFKLEETGEAVRVSSLRPQLPVLSVYRPAVISPDGEQIAFIVLSPEFDDNASGVWVQDLATGQREQVLALKDIPETRSESVLSEGPFLPERLSWLGDTGLLVEVVDRYGSATKISANAFYLELATKEVVALEDFSSLSTEDLFNTSANAEHPRNKVPMMALVTPDGRHYLYAGWIPGGKDIFLWSRSLPFEEEAATLLITIPQLVNDGSETSAAILQGAFDVPATISQDGKRALMLGYLLTLE